MTKPTEEEIEAKKDAAIVAALSNGERFALLHFDEEGNTVEPPAVSQELSDTIPAPSPGNVLRTIAILVAIIAFVNALWALAIIIGL